MATQSNISAIANYAGDYSAVIFEQVFQNLDIAKDVDLIQNLDTPLILPKYTANDGVRPYDSTITQPNGQAGTFSQRTITPRTSMKLLNIIPEELRGTYLSRGLKANAKDYPLGFGQYYWSQQTKKIADEINRNAYFAVDPQSITPYNAGTAYAVGDKILFSNGTTNDYYQCAVITTAGQSPTSTPASWTNINNRCQGAGFGTILAAEYGSLPAANKIATGAITDTNAFDKVVLMYQSMPAEKQALGGEFKVSYNVYQKYLNALLTKFTNGTSFMQVPGSPSLYVYGSGNRWILTPSTWMGASQRIIVTQKENLKMGTDLLSDLNTIGNMVPHIHGFYCKFQFILAYQFVDLDLLYVNDQA
ncbi:hypothetical protein G8759_31270 [Spirosoma aureum]|uniref:DUF2184 domain-containing protein n=1 Tax=Spirosoma aureum TaxID=2692134 RepID=A0A6G9AWY1_9BACT|nr:hypothetical protein [Spirosoma aureum]QIP16805.1 hypothetical protein G8759_31270 [Spirosoma aureum]